MHLDKLISLQINLAPGDYPHARYLLKHQLSIIGPQVNEIVLTLDTKPSKGRFAEGWKAYERELEHYLETEISPFFDVKIVRVDYAPEVKQMVSQFFFSSATIPDKDFRGGPFYAYFYGLHKATNDLVFHLDSDMFIGGGSAQWIQEATGIFRSDPSCFTVAPLPGPPSDDDTLKHQLIIQKIASYKWQLGGMSTRIFMLDKSHFKDNKLILSKPSMRNQFKAIMEGNPNADLPEHMLSAYMNKHHLKRIDFLGQGAGLWSLHPPFRTEAFYRDLSNLIGRVTNNEFPEKQQGFYDIIDEVCDWSTAREKIKKNRWWKRLLK